MPGWPALLLGGSERSGIGHRVLSGPAAGGAPPLEDPLRSPAPTCVDGNNMTCPPHGLGRLSGTSGVLCMKVFVDFLLLRECILEFNVGGGARPSHVIRSAHISSLAGITMYTVETIQVCVLPCPASRFPPFRVFIPCVHRGGLYGRVGVVRALPLKPFK